MSTCARFFPKCHIVEFNIFFGFVFRLRRCWKKEKKKDVLIFQKGENLLPGHKKLKDMCVCVCVGQSKCPSLEHAPTRLLH